MDTDTISSPVINKEWGFTCKSCPYVPEVCHEDDYIRVPRNWKDPKYGETKKTVNLRFPERCKTCDTKKKRADRRKKAIARVFAMSAEIGAMNPTYNYPKLITFALPVQPSKDYEERYRQIKLLEKKLPKARKILMKNGALGGTFAIECTSRLANLDVYPEAFMQWKHHAHVHAVCVSNFVHHSKLSEYCEQLIPLGLGRINLKAPRSYDKVAAYISKYLSKENQRHRTFGIMRGIPKWEPGCRCKHDDMQINHYACECLT
jgi:hypothetical protein